MKQGKIVVAGIGPGDMQDITPAVRTAISSAEVVVGYKYYFQFISTLTPPLSPVHTRKSLIWP